VRNRYLLVGLEHVTPEEVAGCVSCDVTEDFQVLRVVRYVKYPETHQMAKNENTKHSIDVEVIQ
jgi:hypothetical protein